MVIRGVGFFIVLISCMVIVRIVHALWNSLMLMNAIVKIPTTRVVGSRFARPNNYSSLFFFTWRTTLAATHPHIYPLPPLKLDSCCML